jgi:guanylate kinase
VNINETRIQQRVLAILSITCKQQKRLRQRILETANRKSTEIKGKKHDAVYKVTHFLYNYKYMKETSLNDDFLLEYERLESIINGPYRLRPGSIVTSSTNPGME